MKSLQFNLSGKGVISLIEVLQNAITTPKSNRTNDCCEESCCVEESANTGSVTLNFREAPWAAFR